MLVPEINGPLSDASLLFLNLWMIDISKPVIIKPNCNIFI